MSEEASLGDFTEKESEIVEEDEDDSLKNGEFPTLPDDWGVTAINEIISDEANAFTDGARYSLSSAEIHDNGEVRAILLEEIGEGMFDDATPKFATQEKYEEITHRAIYPGEVVVAKMAEPVARACLVPDTYGKYLLGCADVVRIVPNEEVNDRFLMYCMNSYGVWRQAVAHLRGTGRSRINLENISELKIPKPSLEEQRKIVTVLYNIDRIIQKTEEIIDQMENIQQGIEQRLFREGYFDHSDTQEQRLVTTPSGWEFEQLSKHTEDSAFGPRFSSDRYDEDGSIATLRTTDLNDRGHITHETMPVANLEQSEIEEHLLKPGDFMITRSGTTGIGTVWGGYDKPTIPGAFLIRFRFEESINSQFMKYYANSSIGRKRINRRAKGGVQKNLAGSDLLNMRFPIPSVEEQEKIVGVLDTTEKRIKSERKFKNGLQYLKQGLMQDLLSGAVRTHDVDIVIPEAVLAHG